jgi:hypothetical protein
VNADDVLNIPGFLRNPPISQEMERFVRLLDDYVIAYVRWYEFEGDDLALNRDETRAALIAECAALRKGGAL